ncbi:MAG TPA: tetratricopeptide repeat protein [Pyrinomonadaceae bacterium]|jgi:tetratricopeptide (TPR) repeat protein
MIVFLAIFITSFPTPIAANHSSNPRFAQQVNYISGNVTDERHNPIPDLQVELLDDVNSVIQRTKTDNSGLFFFRRITEGIFQVRIQTYQTNYIAQTKRVQLERTRSFEQVDFVLATKPNASGVAAPGEVFVQEIPDAARKQYEAGAALLQKEHQKEGVEALKKALAIFPSYFDALELLGTEYVKQREYEAAIPVLSKGIEVNGRSYQSLYALSVAQHGLKQLPQAIESMRRAIAINGRSVNANLWFGMLLRQTEKLDEAETYLKQANQLAQSKSPDAHWQLALLFNQLKRYSEAADELELFLKIQPDSKDTELIKKLIQRFRQQAAGKQP